MRKFNNMNTRILLSVTALVLIVVLAAGFTFSWAEGGDKGYLNGSDIVISTGSNLTMRQDGKTTNSIIIPACVLEEVSSADGRNFFFPMTDNTSNDTPNMTFREGVASDENKKYVSVDFELEAGDSAADVYLGAGTIVQCDNEKVMNALRMSFSLNDGSTPLVFRPNQMPGITDSYSPITSITSVGTPTVTETTTNAYGSYYFKGEGESTPIFTLQKDEVLNITLSIWLEGTEFTGDDVANSNLSVYIDFTTTVDDLIKYNFVDNCHSRNSGEVNHWVANNMEKDDVEYETMMYIYDNSAQRYYAMEKTSDTTWETYIPVDINNFYFRRYSIDINEWWNQWEPDMTSIPTVNNERTFVAIAGQEDSEGTNLDGCYGYWKDQYGTFRIYFNMQAPFSNLHCYAWDTSGADCASTGSWPGKSMTYVKNTDNGVLYYIDLKESENVAGIQFNNGGVTRVYLEGFDYSVNTAAYVYFTDSNGTKKEPLGAWSGTVANYSSTNTVGNYWVDFTVSQTNQDRYFYIIANNSGGGAQYPESGGAEGKLGRVYKFTNGNTTLQKLAGPYNIDGTNFENYIYNGAAFWYKSDTDNGYYVYTDAEESLIYPVNDPTP